MAVTTPARRAMTPRPGDCTSMRGTLNNAHPMAHSDSTTYITRRAPYRSDSHPPSARTRLDGRLKLDAIRPAMVTVMP